MDKKKAKNLLLILFLIIVVAFVIAMFTGLSAFAYIGIALTVFVVFGYSVIWR